VVDRCAGVLWGLAAGDKNGGPVRMAVLLSESLVECGKYDRDDGIHRYRKWFLGQDKESCFDTGSTFYSVFKHMKQGMSNEEAAKKAQEALPINAGVNAAHRSPPLAMAHFIEDNDLPQVCTQECTITHLHPLSSQVSTVVNVICRELIKGNSWVDSLHTASSKLPHLDQQIKDALETNTKEQEKLDNGGYGPGVLQAAIFFMNLSKDNITCEEIMAKSLSFAGSANFAPVLVGTFCGALYGKGGIPPHTFSHHRDALLNRIDAAANALASTWN